MDNCFSKNILEEVIYKLNKNSSFLINETTWSSPTVGFSYDKSRSIKFMNSLMKSKIINEKKK